MTGYTILFSQLSLVGYVVVSAVSLAHRPNEHRERGDRVWVNTDSAMEYMHIRGTDTEAEDQF